MNWKNEIPQIGRLVTVAFALSAILAGACLFFDSSGDVALGLLVVAWVIAIVIHYAGKSAVTVLTCPACGQIDRTLR